MDNKNEDVNLELRRHELHVGRAGAVLENAGYIRVFEESYDGGQRVLYRKGASNIFINDVFNSK